jgi:hypothetical protein
MTPTTNNINNSNNNNNNNNNNNIKNADFILLIFNCEKYRYKAIKQKETWLKDFILMPYFHVIGNSHLDNDYIFDYEDNILYVKVEDDYNSLPKKVISAYSAISKEYTFKYIFKTDDDQYVSNINFFTTIQKLLLTTTTKINYGGYIINVDKPYLSQYYKIHPELPKNLPILQTRYCSGRFYLLSDLAVQQLLTKIDNIYNEYLEDYAIGLHLNSTLKVNMFNIQTNKYFTDTNYENN